MGTVVVRYIGRLYKAIPRADGAFLNLIGHDKEVSSSECEVVDEEFTDAVRLYGEADEWYPLYGTEDFSHYLSSKYGITARNLNKNLYREYENFQVLYEGYTYSIEFVPDKPRENLIKFIGLVNKLLKEEWCLK